MQERVYIELKQKTSKLACLNIQLTYNLLNNIDYYDIEIKINETKKDIETFKKANHL